MDFKENRLELLVISTVGLLVGSMFVWMSSVTSPQNVTVEEINYEMPKVKSQYVGEFDLSDREVDYEYNNPFSKKENLAVKDIKKDASDFAKQQKTVGATNSKSEKGISKKKGKVETVVVNSSVDAVKKDSLQEMAKTDLLNNQEQVLTKINTSNSEQVEDKKNNLSSEQWKSLVLAQPTRSNVDSFMKAYTNGEVDLSTVYFVMNSLIKNQKAEVQVAGLYIAEKLSTAQSFVLVSNGYTYLNNENKTRAQVYLQTFTRKDRVGAMSQVLASKNQIAVEKATQVILAGLNTVKHVQNQNNDANSSYTNLISYYKNYLPFLRNLLTAQDDQVTSGAQMAISQIETVLSVN